MLFARSRGANELKTSDNSSPTHLRLIESRPDPLQTDSIAVRDSSECDIEEEHEMKINKLFALLPATLMLLFASVPHHAAAQSGKPYQATVVIPANSPDLLGNYGIATITFPPVPKNKRLTVSYVSLRYTSYSIILDAVLTNGQTGTDEQQIELPGAQAISLGVLDGSTYTTSRYAGQVTFSIDGGATPTMTFYGLGAESNFGGALATVVGTLSSE
jgi:hypothetical protein